jgi:hypothetical protein
MTPLIATLSTPALMLLEFIGGIALACAITNPHEVTLRWLRLAGIIALALAGVAAVVITLGASLPTNPHNHTHIQNLTLIIVPISFLIQLITVQRAMRNTQRLAASLAFISVVILASSAMRYVCTSDSTPSSFLLTINLLLTALSSAGLLGGYLMTMLLGHAYLTAGNEMTQRPFQRLTLTLASLLALRSATSIIGGLWPYLHQPSINFSSFGQISNVVLITARYLTGLVIPAVFTYMTYDCIARRSNQSATGILYVTLILIVIGEGVALALIPSTGFIF